MIGTLLPLFFFVRWWRNSIGSQEIFVLLSESRREHAHIHSQHYDVVTQFIPHTVSILVASGMPSLGLAMVALMGVPDSR